MHTCTFDGVGRLLRLNNHEDVTLHCTCYVYISKLHCTLKVGDENSKWTGLDWTTVCDGLNNLFIRPPSPHKLTWDRVYVFVGRLEDQWHEHCQCWAVGGWRLANNRGISGNKRGREGPREHFWGLYISISEESALAHCDLSEFTWGGPAGKHKQNDHSGFSQVK